MEIQLQYTNNQIHEGLTKASNRHAVLKDHFDTFANSVVGQVTATSFFIKGFQAEAYLDENYFVVIFAGRELVFAFESIAQEAGHPLNGVVKCYLEKEYPSDGHGIFVTVKFDGHGKTDLKSQEYPNDPVMLTNDVDALFLVLELVYKSLEK